MEYGRDNLQRMEWKGKFTTDEIWREKFTTDEIWKGKFTTDGM